MLDITKPLVTTVGEPVTILSDKGRLVIDNQAYPLVGYIGNASFLGYWSAEGKAASTSYYDLQYKAEKLYINIYANGNVGVFRDRNLAVDAKTNALTSLSICYIPGEKQF